MLDSTKNSQLVVRVQSLAYFACYAVNMCKISMFHWKSMRFCFSCSLCLTKAKQHTTAIKQWLTGVGTASWLLSSFLGVFCMYAVNMCKISMSHRKTMWFHFFVPVAQQMQMMFNSHVDNDWQCQKQPVGCWVYCLVYFVCM